MVIRRLVRPMASLVLAAFGAGLVVASAGPLDALEAYNPRNLIRLQVVAASDDPEDKRLKLEVRDAVLSVLRPALTGAEGADEAGRRIVASLPEVEAAAQAVLDRAGRPAPVSASLEERWFSARQWGGVVFPAGNYRVLRVAIGAGSGQNWWCVVYPGLCYTPWTAGLDDGTRIPLAIEAEGDRILLRGDGELEALPAEVRFWVVEWVRRFGGAIQARWLEARAAWRADSATGGRR